MVKQWMKIIRIFFIACIFSMVFHINANAGWSEWGTEKPSSSENYVIETKKQYRYSDRITTTSSSSSLSGWTMYDKKSSWSNWGSWSGWGTTAHTASDSKQVETRAEYRYYYFYCPKCGGREPLQGTSDCHKYTLSSSDWHEGWFGTPYSKCKAKSYSYTTAKKYTESLGDGKRWNFSAGNINDTAIGTKDAGSSATVIRRGYRYRTRSLVYTYYYYRWDDWSDWSDTVYSSSEYRKVQTRTLYRYKTGLEQTIKASSKKVTYNTDPFKLNAKASAGGKLKYKSSNKSVATVSKSGKVTPNDYGKTTITITAVENGSYKKATKKITITVVPRKVTWDYAKSTKRGQVNLKWNKDTTVTGYECQISTKSNFSSNTKEKNFKQDISLPVKVGMTSGKTYYVRVRAYKNVNGNKFTGNWSAVKKVKVK